MAERRAEKYLADLYVNGMTTGYNVFYKAKALSIRSRRSWCSPEVTDPSKWWRGIHYYSSSGKPVSVHPSTAKTVWRSPITPSW